MAPFTVVQDSPLSPREAWARVTDWRQHGRWVPLTRVRVTVPVPDGGAGTVFVGRTGTRRLGFDDPMEVVAWTPPGPEGRGHCRIEKRGRVIRGWAELSVEPLPGGGSRTTWVEEATPAGLPAFAAPVNEAAGRALFGRVMRKLLVG